MLELALGLQHSLVKPEQVVSHELLNDTLNSITLTS